MHRTPKPPRLQPIQEYLVTPNLDLADNFFNACPNAQTLIAYSLTHQAEVLYALPCQTWSCRTCAEAKIKKLAHAVQLARPNRLLTLTVDPSLFLTPLEAWQKTRKQVPLLIRRLRLKFGEIEYLRVTEVTKNGWPHYHLLIRSGYLPHSAVKAYWRAQTGARIVDLRQVKKSFSAYLYLVKYLSKLHQLEWTERHVSLSRHFTPKVKSEHPVQIQTAEPDFIRQHPSHVVIERYKGQLLHRLSKNAYVITHPGEPLPVAAASLEKHLDLL